MTDVNLPDTSSGNPISAREQLECRKIEAEIAIICRPFWKQGAFWATISACAVPILGAILAYGSGWFDLKKLEIQNAKTLLQAETVALESEKQTLTTETAKLETIRAGVRADISTLSLLRSEQQLQVAFATNELQLLRRQQLEKEQLLQSLEQQLVTVTKENAAAKELVADFESMQRERDGLRATNFQLRLHLAVAHEYARGLTLIWTKTVSEASKPNNVAGVVVSSVEAMFTLGKWRSVYDNDMKEFQLSEFTNAIGGIVITNSSILPDR